MTAPPGSGPPAPVPARTGDRLGTIALLVGAWLGMLLGGAVVVVLLAYLGSCLPMQCRSGAQSSSYVALIGGVLGVLVTTVWAVVRMVRGKRSWPVGVGAVGVAVVALLVATVGFLAAASGVG